MSQIPDWYPQPQGLSSDLCETLVSSINAHQFLVFVGDSLSDGLRISHDVALRVKRSIKLASLIDCRNAQDLVLCLGESVGLQTTDRTVVLQRLVKLNPLLVLITPPISLLHHLVELTAAWPDPRWLIISNQELSVSGWHHYFLPPPQQQQSSLSSEWEWLGSLPAGMTVDETSIPGTIQIGADKVLVQNATHRKKSCAILQQKMGPWLAIATGAKIPVNSNSQHLFALRWLTHHGASPHKRSVALLAQARLLLA